MNCPGCGYDYPNGCDATCVYKHPALEWIKCSENLPEAPGWYDVCYEKTQFSSRSCGREFWNGSWVMNPFTFKFDIIYWKELPKPPEEK